MKQIRNDTTVTRSQIQQIRKNKEMAALTDNESSPYVIDLFTTADQNISSWLLICHTLGHSPLGQEEIRSCPDNLIIPRRRWELRS